MVSEIYTAAHDEALEMMRSGSSKKDILHFLATAAEKASGPGTVVSILIIDKNGLLTNGASPQLPPEYLNAIDGLKPDPNVGTCAAAAATGNMVITPSFFADNKWSELRHLPTALGFVGAWSMPIKTKENTVLGTFGTYFRRQREPSSEEVSGNTLLASAAALVLTQIKDTEEN